MNSLGSGSFSTPVFCCTTSIAVESGERSQRAWPIMKPWFWLTGVVEIHPSKTLVLSPRGSAGTESSVRSASRPWAWRTSLMTRASESL